MAELTPEEQRTAFASTFKSTTNLAQRRRYQEQIDQYQSDQRQAAQNQYERALGAAEMANPLKAEANRIGQSREQRLRGEAIMREDRFLRQEEERKRQFELQMQNDEKAIALRQSQELRAEEKRAKELELAAQQDEQTHRVFTEITDLALKGIRPGSPKFADAAFKLLRDNPNIPKDVRQGLHKDSHIDIPLEQMDADAERFKNPNFRITRSPNGTSYTVSEAPIPKSSVPKILAPEQQMTALEREHKFLTDEFNATKDSHGNIPNPQLRSHFETRLNEVRKQMYELDKAPPVTSTPAPATPSVSVGAGAATAASASASQTVPVIDDFSSPEYQNLPMGTKFQDSRGNNMIKKGPNDDPLSPDTRRFLDKEKQAIADGLFGSK